MPETYSVSITGLRSPLSQDEQVVWMGHMLDSGQILWHAPHPVGKEGAKDVQLICNSPVSLSLHDEELRRIVELALDPERPMSMWAADYLSQMSGEFWARRRNCISRDRIAEAIRNHSENTSWCLCVAHLGILIQEQESESYVREQFRQLEAQGLLFLCVRHIECLLILDEEAALQDFERKCTSSNTSENSVQASAYRIAIYAAGD